MPTRPSKRRKMPRDVNQLAARIVSITTEEQSSAPPEPESDTRNQAAVALGMLGASKGGKARAKSLSKKKRSEIAKRAAASRWKKGKG